MAEYKVCVWTSREVDSMLVNGYWSGLQVFAFDEVRA